MLSNFNYNHRRGSVIVEFDVIMTGDEGAVAQGSTAALEKLRTEGQLAEFTVDKDSVKLGIRYLHNYMHLQLMSQCLIQIYIQSAI